MMYQRNHVKHEFNKLKTTELVTEYRKLRNQVTKNVRLAKRIYFENELSQVTDNPKKTWKLINRLTGGSSRPMPPNELSADEFNEHFSSIGAETVKNLPPINDPPWKGLISERKFRMKDITISSVSKQLKSLGLESSTDVIGFDRKLLCLGADILAPTLTSLFNTSLRSCVIPPDWKHGRVTPVFKGKGDRLDKSNYRPISVLPHIAKLFEREVQSQLMSFLVENNYITIDQSAYRQHHGTQTSLQRVLDDWLDAICDDMYVGVCLLDISKCFDTIDHDILYKKLQYYGVVDNEYAFFKSYLSERTQIVSYNKVSSSVAKLQLGVPQGSVLGPLLFLLYVNDVNQHIYLGKANIYADDTLIYYAGSTIEDVEYVLQKCLDHAIKWYEGNRLVINPIKCVSLLVSNIHKKPPANSLNVTLNDDKVTQVNSTKYLGVQIHEFLSWDQHVGKLCSQLSFKISKLARIRAFTPVHTLRKIYFACIQPTIDYAITVWGNTTLENISKVQRLQNFAARILANNFDYISFRGLDILKSLKIMNVNQRIVYFNLILMFKCIHGLAPDYLCDQILMSFEVSERNTRFNDFNNVYIPFPRKDILKTSFMFKASQLWNGMPNGFKDITSLLTFKLYIKHYIFNNF